MLRPGYERRRHLSEGLRGLQDQALGSSIYLLREMGPTGFLLREEEPENRDFRVTTAPLKFLSRPADPGYPQARLTPQAHSCACPRRCRRVRCRGKSSRSLCWRSGPHSAPIFVT
ncbi:E3 ubiquitin-protein ligase ZSWIM2 [Tupaia chinensis]|uniref:E3 ubiquitin-protein ligase ZSWIM2 n=1 Tax=Tupaia chinensis TaxID=246437 RepID=L9KUY2_TUPCH|nr:E3 ubiquitin-protein ligase ZSWIM2 [Tupaia chinensis]